MIIVVELLKTGPNIFKCAGNFITYDGPDPSLIGYRIFWTKDEAKSAYHKGASIFGMFGPAGYKAFRDFEYFLRREGIIPPAPPKKLQKWRKPSAVS